MEYTKTVRSNGQWYLATADGSFYPHRQTGYATRADADAELRARQNETAELRATRNPDGTPRS